MTSASGVARQRRSGNRFLPCYFIFLLVAQAAYAVYYGYSPALRANYVLQILIRLALWTAPVIVHLALSGKNIPAYLKLNTNVKRGVTTGLAVGCSLILLSLVGHLALRGHVSFNLLFGADKWWKAVIAVGLSEEVVFRGYFLREFSSRMNFWMANILQATAFLAIHIPGWIVLRQFALPGIIQLAGYVFLAGVVLGLIWKRTGSLWGCMIAHSFSNFVSFAIR